MQEPGTQFDPAPLPVQPAAPAAVPDTAWQNSFTPSPVPGTPIPAPTGALEPTWQTSLASNDSGSGPGAVLPPELKGFNIGAAFLTWIWSIGHQFWLGLLLFPISFAINLVHLGALSGLLWIGSLIVFGMKGNEWAWQYRRWDSIEKFKETEKVWAMWGIALFCITILMFVVLAVLVGGVFMAAMMHAGGR